MGTDRRPLHMTRSLACTGPTGCGARRGAVDLQIAHRSLRVDGREPGGELSDIILLKPDVGEEGKPAREVSCISAYQRPGIVSELSRSTVEKAFFTDRLWTRRQLTSSACSTCPRWACRLVDKRIARHFEYAVQVLLRAESRKLALLATMRPT